MGSCLCSLFFSFFCFQLNHVTDPPTHLLVALLCSKSRVKLPGSSMDVPSHFVYGSAAKPAWIATKDGVRVTQKVFQELFDKLKFGLQELEYELNTMKRKGNFVSLVVTPFEEPETHWDEDGAIELGPADDNCLFRRHMFQISVHAGEKTENGRSKLITTAVVPLVKTAGEDYSTSVQEEPKKGVGGARPPWEKASMKYLNLKVLQTWDKLHEGDGVDHRWFLYLVDFLIGLVPRASSSLIQPTLANVMCFNSGAKVAAKPQALHLDNSPKEIYPDLFTDDGDIKYTYAEVQEMIKTGKSWFPRIWLYFLAFEDNHAIDIFHDPHGFTTGIDVAYLDHESVPTEESLKGLQERYLHELKLPFGSIAFVAGSVIHRGIGSGTEPPMDPCYRLHAFCHVAGHDKNINAAGTYILQREESLEQNIASEPVTKKKKEKKKKSE